MRHPSLRDAVAALWAGWDVKATEIVPLDPRVGAVWPSAGLPLFLLHDPVSDTWVGWALNWEHDDQGDPWDDTGETERWRKISSGFDRTVAEQGLLAFVEVMAEAGPVFLTMPLVVAALRVTLALSEVDEGARTLIALGGCGPAQKRLDSL